MPSKRQFLIALALLALLPFAVACGGQTAEEAEQAAEEAQEGIEETAEEAAEAVEEAAEETAEAVEEAAEEAEEALADPQVEGEVRLTNEDFEWTETTTETANYTWTARVTNDTTATLDITVTFEFLDNADRVVKTERASRRLAPAESSSISQQGSMPFDQANRVVGFRAYTDYDVVG